MPARFLEPAGVLLLMIIKLLLLPLNLVQLLLTWVWMTFGVLTATAIMLLTRRPGPALWFAHRPWSPVAMAILLGRVQVDCETEIDWSRTHIFVSNHQSMADIPAMLYSLRTPVRFIAKRELFKLPVVGWYLRSTGMIAVDRAGGRAATQGLIREAARDFSGSSIIAFPEGTRSRNGTVARFKKGVFLLALQSGLPLVPVALEGTRHLASRSGLTSRPARVRVRIGTPIETAGLGSEDLGQLVARTQGEVVRMHRLVGGEEPAVSEQTMAGETGA